MAFAAGIVTFFTPCSYAMLPAYISFIVGKDVEKGRNFPANIALKGAGLGGAATLGFVSLYAVVGGLISLAGEGVRQFFPGLLVAISAILIAMGVMRLAKMQLQLPGRRVGQLKATYLSFYIFGISYALAAAACVFPVFLAIALSALAAGGFLGGLLVFVVYALGMGAMMMLVSVAVSLSRVVLVRRLSSMMPHVERASAAILVAAGIYILFYWYVNYVTI